MDRISAAGNLTISIEPNHWRLSVAGNFGENMLIEAVSGESLRYTRPFAEKRRLPSGGTLAIAQIQRVVTGWSREDESWHLGLLFEPSLAEARGSRWCELARWPDPDTTVFADVATRAGRSLARILARPYNLIEPAITAKSAQPPQPPLRSLPLEFDQWRLERSSILQFKRSSRWARARVIRVVWYGLLVLVYIALSVLSLQGAIALPKPEFLPYLGLAMAVVLIGIMLYTFYQLVTQPNQILVDSSGVRARHASGDNWQISRNDVQAVYVSEIVNKKGKKRVVYHGELNLYLQDGTFRTFLEQPHSTEDGKAPASTPPVEEVIMLTSYNAHSDLQVAGLYVANALNVECRYDRRVK
jgi:hypothetical protein